MLYIDFYQIGIPTDFVFFVKLVAILELYINIGKVAIFQLANQHWFLDLAYQNTPNKYLKPFYSQNACTFIDNQLFSGFKTFYYIPITDATLELSVFWPSDTGSRINELRFSEFISLSFKMRLTSVTCFCGDVT